MPDIADIVTQVMQGKSLVKVVINDAETFSLSPGMYHERPLRPNDPVDMPAFRDWLLRKQYPEALSKAVRYLASRSRSRQEVVRKLQSYEYMEKTVMLVLLKLEKERLVDDEDFARVWASGRMRRGLGRNRILQELRQKGVSRQAAEKACANVDPEERDEDAAKLALKLLKRYAGEPDSAKVIRKVYAAMNRRGFAFEEASAAVSRAIALDPQTNLDRFPEW